MTAPEWSWWPPTWTPHDSRDGLGRVVGPGGVHCVVHRADGDPPPAARTRARSEPTEPTEPADPNALSTLGVLSWNGTAFEYPEGVHPYVLATTLFSDFAVKERAIALPEGTQATYTARGVLEFPDDTVIVKSFLFPADLRAPDQDLRVIETRVLTKEDGEWRNWPYLWNEEQTEAFRAPSGAVVNVEVVGFDGNPFQFPLPRAPTKPVRRLS